MDKDFKLKTGDKVTWVDRVQNKKHTRIVKSSDYNIEQFESYCVCGEVVKVLRPTGYKTVYEAEKAILDKEEKEYLSAIIKPFKKRIKFIEKRSCLADGNKYYLHICVQSSFNIPYDEEISLPYFKDKEMYNGMRNNRKYNLKELGLE